MILKYYNQYAQRTPLFIHYSFLFIISYFSGGANGFIKKAYLYRHRAKEILSANDETDPLTWLFNMSYFYHKIQTLLSSPQGRRQEVSFIHFDIPNFKLYNERHGFKLGDELLCDLARTIRGCFENAIAARFSDDHFFVCDTGSRSKVPEKVEAVYKKMLLTDDANKRVRIKAGIYFLDDRYAEVGLACDHARLACNSIKGLEWETK